MDLNIYIDPSWTSRELFILFFLKNTYTAYCFVGFKLLYSQSPGSQPTRELVTASLGTFTGGKRGGLRTGLQGLSGRRAGLQRAREEEQMQRVAQRG